jgi:hypothetical protein
MARATQIVASSVEVLPTSLENAPRPDNKIRAKVLAKPIETNAKGKGKDSEMSANDRWFRTNKEGPNSPLL